MAECRRAVSVRVVNLGCPKNVVDAEEMLGVLGRSGFTPTVSDGADVVIVNTCGFIEAAKQESIDAILAEVERKKRGDVRRIVVAGCLSQRYGRELSRELPEVDAFVGAGDAAAIGDVVGSALVRTEQIVRVPRRPHHRWVDEPTRMLSTRPWTAYLKISEGCDHRCTFCAIPAMRGKHVSKPMDRVLEEARRLASAGVRELNLIAQDSTQYGYDLYGRAMLPDLLRELSSIDGVRWLRLFYCYPSRVNARFIEAMASTPKVCQYIDMPLQHADDDVLRAMRRPMTGDGYLRLLARLRAASPDVCIRTTFIVGFPGETDAQFENLLRFVERAQFDRAGAFEYSAEDGTPAARLGGPVSARMRRARRDALMRTQQEVSLARNRCWIGRELEVLVERVGLEAGGRSFRDAPEIDGTVTLTGCLATPGEFVRVRVTGAGPYDLAAETVG